MNNQDYKVLGRLLARLIVELNLATARVLFVACKELQRAYPFFDRLRFETFVINTVKRYKRDKDND